MSAREHAIAWRRAYQARVCDRVEPWAHGTVVRISELPSFYDYNLARVEGPDPGLSGAELAAAAEPALADLGHRRIEIEDGDTGLRVAEDFARIGWVTERLAFLFRALPGPEAAGPAGVELSVEDFEATRPLRVSWQSESVWGETPEFALVEEEVARRRGHARRDRARGGRAGRLRRVLRVRRRRRGGARLRAAGAPRRGPRRRAGRRARSPPPRPAARARRSSRPTTSAPRSGSTSGSASAPSGGAARSRRC